jgi:trehalose-6-phosphate hydrolase
VESLNMFAELRATGRDPDELLAILASKSRDNGRTPMQWDASHNAGFTAGEPWISVCDNYETVNARAALGDPDSVFYTYQALIRLRKTLPVLTWGDYEDLLPDHPYLWCYRRQWQGQTLIVAANLSPAPQEWRPDALHGEWNVVMSNYAGPDAAVLRPFEAVWWLQA